MTFTASGVFGLTLKDIFGNDTAIDWPADTVKGALFTNSITTPNYATNTAYGAAPFNANEVPNGSGYTTGGATLGSKTSTIVGSTLVLDGADLSWAAATFSGVRGVLLYDDTIATPVNDPALVGVTFGADFAVTAGTFTIVWNASGICVATFA